MCVVIVIQRERHVKPWIWQKLFTKCFQNEKKKGYDVTPVDVSCKLVKLFLFLNMIRSFKIPYTEI